MFISTIASTKYHFQCSVSAKFCNTAHHRLISMHNTECEPALSPNARELRRDLALPFIMAAIHTTRGLGWHWRSHKCSCSWTITASQGRGAKRHSVGQGFFFWLYEASVREFVGKCLNP